MRRRLILSTALIALAAVVVLGVPLGIVEAARVREDTTGRLEREADAAASVVDDRVERGEAISPGMLARVVPARHRIVLTTPRGRRVATGPPLHGEIVSVHSGSQLGVSVLAQEPAAELDRRVHRAWLLIGLLSVGGVLTAVALAALQARRLARPLEAIARRSAQLGDGDFSVRAGHFGVPEVDAIARGLDSSAERIAELVAAEREFSANVSHQLRTPLTALRLRLERVLRSGDAAVRAREVDAALAEADRLEGTIADLLAHARRASGGERIEVHLASVVHDHTTAWRPVFERSGRRLEVAVAKNTRAHASPGTVGQVLGVLLDNALRHGAGTVRVEVTAAATAAVIAVSDQGAGVPPADQEAIFERGASRSGGTGIGLHLARALAEADGGVLGVAEDATARFELRLPLNGRFAAPSA